MGKQNDKVPENNKPKKTAYLVCDGAMCMCDSGAKPAKLKVTKNTKVYINEESKKLLATEKDWTFDPPSVPFGSCKNKPGQDKSCTPAFIKWDKPYDSISADGHKVITDKSELVCQAFQGKVTVLKHGQVQQVSAGQIANLNQVIASQVNPMAPPPKRIEPGYNVSVTGIEAEIPETENNKSLSGQKREKVQSKKKPANLKSPVDIQPVNSILVRPGEEVMFTASYKAGGSEPLISWKVTDISGGAPYFYLQQGKEFTTFFPEEGTYRVEAYGTGKDGRLDSDFDSDSGNVRKEYDDCSLFVDVRPNELTQLKLSGDNSNIIPGGKLPDSVRAGFPVKIEPIFFYPPVKEDTDKLVLLVRDAEGHELGRVEGMHKFLFTPANTGAKYSAEALYTTAETEVKKTLEFKTKSNTVKVIGGTIGEGEMARPGTEIIFNVEKTTFNGDVKDFEGEQIKWKLAGSDVVLGRGTEFKRTFEREGDFIIEAYVNSSNAVMAMFRGKGEADDWCFTITQNYIKDIKFNGKPKIGRTILFTADTLFKPNYHELKDISWTVNGPVNSVHTGESSMKVLFSQKGKYTIKASLNGKSKEIIVECVQCEIHEGWWTDKDGNYLAASDPESDPANTIGFAGWNQEVCASFKQTGLGGEKALIKIFDKDKLDEDDFIYSKEVTIPDKLLVGFTFELTEELKKKAVTWLSNGPYASLYFTVEILDKALKVIKNEVALPLIKSWYLQVDDRPRCKAYFADNNDTKRYSVASQTTPVFAQLKTTGYQEVELLVEIWESVSWLDKKLLGDLANQKPDRFGMLSVPLDLKKIKLKDANETKQLYIKVFTKENHDEIYSSDGKYMLTLHQVLKTEAVSKATTKALVVVDYSELKKNEVKQIVFPLLVTPENDSNNKWGKNYYWGAGKGTNLTSFNTNRSNGTRKHAGRDLYSKPYTPVVAICDGEILEIADFYCETHQITVKHETEDGRKFIIRYGELDPKSITLKTGNKVVQQQVLGNTGKLVGLTIIQGFEIFMLHFEYYSGAGGLNINKPLTDRNNTPFQRRSDLVDPIEILKEGYKNTFKTQTESSDRSFPSSLKLSQKGKEFIKDWEQFKPMPYNDSKDYCTIGYGHLIAENLCDNITIPSEFQNGITKEKALELFEVRLKTFEKIVQTEVCVKLFQHEYDAVVSLVFNLGSFAKCPLLKSNLNSSDYKGAAKEFLDITNGGTTGLVKRRKAENDIFLNKIYDSTH